MKTRVIRYWHQTDWLYKVQQWTKATGKEDWIMDVYTTGVTQVPAGEWYWKHVVGAISLSQAEDIAQRLVNGWQYTNEPDVVAEYGA